jgi:hypothetical protein
LASSDTTDIVDAHVAAITGDGDRLLTSDAHDLRRLLQHRNATAVIVEV